MVDLFSDTRNFTVTTKLADDVLVVLALAECHGLVDWLIGVGNDVLKLERAELVPLLLSGLQSDSVRLLIGVSISVVVIKLLDWCFLLSRAAEG